MKKVIEGFRFVFQDLRTDGWRSIITIINLTVFISCYFCLASLAEAGYKFGSQEIDPSRLMMITHNVFDLSDSKITDQDLEPVRELMPATVLSVSPLILKHLNIDGFLLQVRGAPLEDFQPVHSLSLLEGSWPVGEHEVVIGEGTVSLTNWKIGDNIEIYGVEHEITGITRSAGTKFGSVWMNLQSAEQLFGTNGTYQFAWIVLQPEMDSQGVISELNNDPRLKGYFDVYFADQMYEQYSQALKDIKAISSMLVILSLICVMLGVYGSTYLTLNERCRELTIMRSIGFGARAIRLVLSMRTFLQVVAAFLLGWVISIISIQGFEKIHPIMIRSIPLPVLISVKTILIGLILGLLFAWFGVWLPTRHLRKSSVISMIQR